MTRFISCLGHLAILAILAALGGCAQSGDATDSAGGRMELGIATIGLTGVDDAIWKIDVVNEDGEAVWSATVESSSYGDGKGSISYVGPCDASGSGLNTVTVTLLDLVPLSSAEWANPGPLSQTVMCTANADAQVQFDVTVLRSASQGFVDIAVNFDVVFCSAKADCINENGEDLTLVPGIGGDRLHSVVTAVSCVAAEQTDLHLYATDFTVTCSSGETYTYSPLPDGLSFPQPIGDFGFAESQLNTFGETSMSGTVGLYWSVALGLSPSVGTANGQLGCTLTGLITATDGALPNMTIPPGAAYPVIQWSVPLTGDDGAVVCGAHSLFEGDEVIGIYATQGQQFLHSITTSTDAPADPQNPPPAEGGSEEGGGND